MRKSKMLAKFRSGRFARVCGLGHMLPFFVRYAAHHKFDGVLRSLFSTRSRNIAYTSISLFCF